MEAIFSFKISELNDDLLKQIRSFAKNDDDIFTITISSAKEVASLNETNTEFLHRIQSRIDEYHSSDKYLSVEDDSLANIVNEPEP